MKSIIKNIVYICISLMPLFLQASQPAKQRSVRTADLHCAAKNKMHAASTNRDLNQSYARLIDLVARASYRCLQGVDQHGNNFMHHLLDSLIHNKLDCPSEILEKSLQKLFSTLEHTITHNARAENITLAKILTQPNAERALPLAAVFKYYHESLQLAEVYVVEEACYSPEQFLKRMNLQALIATGIDYGRPLIREIHSSFPQLIVQLNDEFNDTQHENYSKYTATYQPIISMDKMNQLICPLVTICARDMWPFQGDYTFPRSNTSLRYTASMLYTLLSKHPYAITHPITQVTLPHGKIKQTYLSDSATNPDLKKLILATPTFNIFRKLISELSSYMRTIKWQDPTHSNDPGEGRQVIIEMPSLFSLVQTRQINPSYTKKFTSSLNSNAPEKTVMQFGGCMKFQFDHAMAQSQFPAAPQTIIDTAAHATTHTTSNPFGSYAYQDPKSRKIQNNRKRKAIVFQNDASDTERD